MSNETVRVLIGTLGKPHGLRGELTVFCRTDLPELRFAVGAPVEVGPGGKPMTVAGSHWHSGVLLVSLAGVSDRTAAEALRGYEVWARVPADETPDDDGEYFDRQLIGLVVQNSSGDAVGRVISVFHNPGQDLLVLDVGGSERLVPFVEALVPIVDTEAGYLRVADVGGLLDEAEDA